MKATRDDVSPVGLTVLYEPEPPSAAIADIVFVAGIGGHPVNTWLYTPPPPIPSDPPRTPRRTRSFRSRPSKHLVKQPSLSRSPSASNLHRSQKPRDDDQSASKLENGGIGDGEGMYWPLDLLPRSCPEARVLTWGCRDAALGRRRGAKGDVLSLADGLLRELTLRRKETKTARRPIIFVAHSLGGTIVKEALRRSEAAHGPSRSLLPSISAVLFLACPHRSTELGSLADAVRSAAGQCLGESDKDYALRRSMGLTVEERKGLEGLEAGREAFERVWRDWNFGVACFREGRGEGVGYELRRAAASMGDDQASAETLDADHLGTSKFRSSNDSNYNALLSSLTSFLQKEAQRRQKLNPKENECLAVILPPQKDPPPPAYPGTDSWPHDHPAFNAWLHRRDRKNRLLWIQAPPGAGKSTLLRSLCARVKAQYGPAAAVVSATAEGRDLDAVYYLPCRGKQGGPAAVYRSLLGGLFPHDARLRRALLSIAEKGRGVSGGLELSDADAVTFFVEEYITHRVETATRRTFIFVDASDGCSPPYVATLASHLAQLARNSNFTICLASDHPTSSPRLHPPPLEISMREHNADDISRYVSLNLHAECSPSTAQEVASRSGGIYLWAEIVVNVLNAAAEEGAPRSLIEDIVSELPGDLYGLYTWILGTLSPVEKADCLALMQCVILSPEPIPLEDLAVATQLMRPRRPGDTPATALDLKPPSRIRFDSPHAFHRHMRSRSLGLLELQPCESHEPLGLRRVRVVHGSVADFFLKGGGYACLAGREAEGTSFSDAGHYSLSRACLEFLNTVDLTALECAASPLSTSPSSPSAPPRRNFAAPRHDTIPPFLRYAVTNLAYHLLSPTPSRYSLPQLPLFRLLARDDLWLYARWTALLHASTPSEVLSASESAQELLARFPAGRLALERVLRALRRLSTRKVGVATGLGLRKGGSERGANEVGMPVTPSTAGSAASVWSPGVVWTPLTPVSVGKGLAAH